MLEIPTVCTEAITMLRTWKEAYCYTRLEIEKSGKEQKWEFDKNKLFKEMDYIAAVASDLFDMAQVYKLFTV
jgi:dynein heavy chain